MILRIHSSVLLNIFIHFSLREGANKRGNSSRLTQSFHFFMFEPIFSPVNALNQPI
ncbi:sugar kinase (plasmid) [Escherichia coli]|nr:sugar kinase [Escherichia coli]